MKLFYLFPLALALSPLQAAVDPGLLALVMPDAVAVAGVQVEQGQASPFGRFLISKADINPARDRLIAETGFDPLRDLREVVVASGGQNQGVVLGRGYFQPSRVTAAANQSGATITSYKGLDIVIGKGPHDSGLSFLDTSTVVLGDVAGIKGVIDRRAAGASYSGELAQRARDIASNHDAWVVGTAPANLMTASPADPQTRILQTIRQFSGGARFGSAAIAITAEATTASAQDAQSLADALRFLSSMIPPDPKVAPLLASARFTADGAVTRVSLDLPEDQVEALFASASGPRSPQQLRRR